MVKDVRKQEVERPVIYQLLVRTFGNANESRVPNGSMEENGCGKFADIGGGALTSLKQMGFTHIWLTGVLEQASGTDYPNRPADDPALLKGKAMYLRRSYKLGGTEDVATLTIFEGREAPAEVDFFFAFPRRFCRFVTELRKLRTRSRAGARRW